jgi:hypothetical protein
MIQKLLLSQLTKCQRYYKFQSLASNEAIGEHGREKFRMVIEKKLKDMENRKVRDVIRKDEGPALQSEVVLNPYGFLN